MQHTPCRKCLSLPVPQTCCSSKHWQMLASILDGCTMSVSPIPVVQHWNISKRKESSWPLQVCKGAILRILLGIGGCCWPCQERIRISGMQKPPDYFIRQTCVRICCSPSKFVSPVPNTVVFASWREPFLAAGCHPMHCMQMVLNPLIKVNRLRVIFG